jgi:hypothetical protein
MGGIQSGSGTARRVAGWLAENRELPLPDVLRLFGRLAGEVDSLDQRGQAHRAIDEEHVLVDRRRELQLTAPGPRRRFDGEACDPEYCPPELMDAVVILPAQLPDASAVLQRCQSALNSPLKKSVNKNILWPS